MSERIGLAINYNYPDYGGMLQAFATQHYLQLNGIESEAIDVTKLQDDINSKKKKYFLHSIFDISVIKDKSGTVKKIIKEKTDKKFKENINQRIAALENFSQSHFVTSAPYRSWEELTKACSSHYSAVLVGSDQLWLPSNIWGDYYTLNFVPDNVKKISYATSFGVSELPQNTIAKAQIFLKRIDFLSAREKTGQSIIKELIQKDVPLVCDPTMLLNSSDWSSLLPQKSIVEEPYIFCYLMGDNPEQRNLIQQFAEKSGLKIVTLPHLDKFLKYDETYSDFQLYQIDPLEFLSLIRDATYVITDSFHGSVFSILFHKNFVTLRRFHKKSTLSTNSRLDTLLGMLDLKNRLAEKDENLESVLTQSIDFSVTDLKLQKFREDSITYLKGALQ